MKKPEPCKECDGWGQRWLCDHMTNPSAKSSWQTCERCNGDGFEPEEEQEEDADDE